MRIKTTISKLRGLPQRFKRRGNRFLRFLRAAFRNGALLKVVMRVPGARIDPSFDPNSVKQYVPVGQCIYCLASGPSIKLSAEHILPYSIGGDAVLPKASCEECAKITSRFEGYCAEHIFLSIRVHHKVHSRSAKPTHLPIFKVFAPPPYGPQKVLVPVGEHPGFLILPSFDPPGIVMANERAPLERPGIHWHTYPLADDQDKRVRQLQGTGLNAVKLAGEFDPSPFLRMLAKIGHGMAVADFGIKGFRPLLIDVILKDDPSIYNFVGSATDRTPPPEPMKTWARTEVRPIGEKQYVVAFFRLFAYLGTPVYTVVVGERIC